MSHTCASVSAPYVIYNIGNIHPVELIDYISAFEAAFGKTAQKDFVPMQSGYVMGTFSDMSYVKRDFHFSPKADVREDLKRYVARFCEY